MSSVAPVTEPRGPLPVASMNTRPSRRAPRGPVVADPPLPADAAIDQLMPRSAQAYDLLRNAIVSLWLKPGEPVNEKAIGEQLGISRTPVREALMRLADEGLVRVYPQAGTFISPIDLEHVFEGQIVRDALEMAMIRRAVGRLTPAFAARLEAILAEQRRCSERDDHQGFYAADEEFHRTISQCAGSPRIWRIINNAKAQLDRVRRLNMPMPGQLDQIMREHQAIFDGLLSGRQARAARALKIHLDTVFDNVQLLMERHAEYFSTESLDRLKRRPARARRTG